METKAKIVTNPAPAAKEPVLNPALAKRVTENSGLLWGAGTFGFLSIVELRTGILMFQDSRITPTFFNELIPAISPLLAICAFVTFAVAVAGCWDFLVGRRHLVIPYIVLTVPLIMAAMIVALIFSYWTREALMHSCFEDNYGRYGSEKSCSEIPFELSVLLGAVLSLVLLAANGVIVAICFEAAKAENSNEIYTPSQPAAPPPVLDNIMD